MYLTIFPIFTMFAEPERIWEPNLTGSQNPRVKSRFRSLRLLSHDIHTMGLNCYSHTKLKKPLEFQIEFQIVLPIVVSVIGTGTFGPSSPVWSHILCSENRFNQAEASESSLSFFVRKPPRSPKGNVNGNPTELRVIARRIYHAAMPATNRKAPPA